MLTRVACFRELRWLVSTAMCSVHTFYLRVRSCDHTSDASTHSALRVATLSNELLIGLQQIPNHMHDTHFPYLISTWPFDQMIATGYSGMLRAYRIVYHVPP